MNDEESLPFLETSEQLHKLAKKEFWVIVFGSALLSVNAGFINVISLNSFKYAGKIYLTNSFASNGKYFTNCNVFISI